MTTAFGRLAHDKQLIHRVLAVLYGKSCSTVPSLPYGIR